MSEKHIAFHEWEEGMPIDEEHLLACPECRQEWEMVRFLRFQTDNVPNMPVPPFFAARVTRLAGQNSVSVWDLMGVAARRLMPAFSALVVVLALLNLGNPGLTPSAPRPSGVEIELAGFLTESPPEMRASVDDVFLSLTEALEANHAVQR